MQQFEAIRPYNDADVPVALESLRSDRAFLDMIARFRAPGFSRWLPWVVRRRVSAWLQREFGAVRTVDQLQQRIYPLAGRLIDKTTSRLTFSGLEALDPARAYLFFSNHRDIVFDPMVVNYVLAGHGHRTTRIAIGDNLLRNQGFAELMRLNKSFVVRRNLSSPRAMRDAYLTLSGFIRHSISENESIWIAQREGRAKDGRDCTDPAILKMLWMSQKKDGVAFSDAMARLDLVPVTISYEFDPCDTDKARELEARSRDGNYTKAPEEDTLQIMKGMSGYKGHVHVHFGAPVKDVPETPRELAEQIDRAMHRNYRLQSSNLAAYHLSGLHPDARSLPGAVSDAITTSETWTEAELQAADEEMGRRLENCDPALRPYVLAMYSNPVVAALNASGP